MVPLRSIANALGYKIMWDLETKAIQLGENINLQIGKDNYNLGSNTVLVDGSSFVPLSFFKEVLGDDRIQVSEEGIFLDDEEAAVSSEPSVELLENELESILNADTADHLEVNEYDTLADIDSALSKFMSGDLAADWVDDFFREEDGAVYKIGRDQALLIDFDEQYYLEPRGTNQFVLMQEHRSQLRGHVVLKVEYEQRGDEWVMVDRYVERYQIKMAEDVPPSIKGMEQEFKFILLAQGATDSKNRVPGYPSLEWVRNTLMSTMTQPMAEKYVETYYREEADGIYLNSTSAPIWIQFDLPYELNEVNDDRYVLTQEHESMLHGHVELQVTYERFANRGWLMTSRERVKVES